MVAIKYKEAQQLKKLNPPVIFKILLPFSDSFKDGIEYSPNTLLMGSMILIKND